MSLVPRLLKFDARELPIQADRTHGGRVGDLVVANVVDLKGACIDVAQHHVGVAEAAEVAETQGLKVQSHRAQRGRICDDVVVGGNVIYLECAAGGVAQQHVGGVAVEEAAERDKPPIASNVP
jgi:hypothetical protein